MTLWLFVTPDTARDMAGRYRKGGLGYCEVQKELIELIWNYFAPYREHREELMNDKEAVRRILLDGAEKARYHAVKTIRKVRKKVGSQYFKE